MYSATPVHLVPLENDAIGLYCLVHEDYLQETPLSLRGFRGPKIRGRDGLGNSGKGSVSLHLMSGFVRQHKHGLACGLGGTPPVRWRAVCGRRWLRVEIDFRIAARRPHPLASSHPERWVRLKLIAACSHGIVPARGNRQSRQAKRSNCATHHMSVEKRMRPAVLRHSQLSCIMSHFLQRMSSP